MKWVFIFDGDLVESTIVNSRSKRLVFFSTKKNPAPRGDVDGRMKPNDSESSI